MNKGFFENGILTSTEAQNMCNLANELAGGLREQLTHLSFTNEYVSSILNTENKLKASEGIYDIKWIPEALNKIGQYNSLCAWLKEAIKSKEAMLDSIEYPQFTLEAPIVPSKPCNYHEEYVMYNIWDADKLYEYYSLEAKAAAFGKALDMNGNNFTSARKELLAKTAAPCKVVGSGQDIVVYEYKASVTKDEVEYLQIELMKKHREFNASLNKLKAELKDTVDALNMQRLKDYNIALQEYNEKHDAYTAAYRKYIAEKESYMIQKKQEISKLHIAIPKDLMSTYKELKALMH